MDECVNEWMMAQGPVDHFSALTRLHGIMGSEEHSREQKWVALACLFKWLP